MPNQAYDFISNMYANKPGSEGYYLSQLFMNDVIADVTTEGEIRKKYVSQSTTNLLNLVLSKYNSSQTCDYIQNSITYNSADLTLEFRVVLDDIVSVADRNVVFFVSYVYPSSISFLPGGSTSTVLL
jgi:hypothetical protein